MSELASEAMESEFGTVARWTQEAVAVLGPEHAVPAGCRGSGSEAALRWLAGELAVRPGERVLDAGSGVGGPAGWLAGQRGVRPACVEPMAAAARAGRALFGLPSVVAVSQALPLASGVFDAAWSLGVLCTTEDKAELLAELHRVLVPGGRLGLLVFVAEGELTPPLPDGNSFPAPDELDGLLAGARFTVTATARADLADSPPEWQQRAADVDEEVKRRHGEDPRWAQAQEQAARVGRLLGSGALVPRLVCATAG